MTRVHSKRRAADAAPPQTQPRAISIFLVCLLVAACGGAYANSFQGAFVFDDDFHIVSAENIRHLSTISSWALGNPRPLVTFSLALNYAIDGLRPWGFHAFNLAVHLLAGLILFDLLRRTLMQCSQFSGSGDRAAPWLALAIALIWLIHPLQTESVTYIIQRAESMMGLFYLLTLYAFVRAVDASRPSPWYVLSVLSCGLGMGCKVVIATALAMVLLYDWFFVAPSLTTLMRKRWHYYAAMLMTVFITLLLTGQFGSLLGATPGTERTAGFGVRDYTPLQYLSSQPGVVLHYLRLAFWPHPLCIDYGWEIPANPWGVIVPGLPLLALLFATVWAMRRRHPAGYPGVWFFLVIAPSSSFIPVQDLAVEHRMYLPLAAVVTSLVFGIYRLLNRLVHDSTTRVVISTVLLIVATLALGWQTHQRNQTYHSAEAMWADVLSSRPGTARSWSSYGIALGKANKVPEAMHAFAMAERFDANAPNVTHLYRANALMEMEKYEEALRELETCLRFHEDTADVHTRMAMCLNKLGRVQEALSHLQTVLRLEPTSDKAHCNLGAVLLQIGRDEDAIAHFNEALKIRPESSLARHHLAMALFGQGHVPEAIEQFEKALRIDPLAANTHYWLGRALLVQQRTSAALHHWRESLRIDPNAPELAFDLAWALATVPEQEYRDGAEALRLAQRGIELTRANVGQMFDVQAAAMAQLGRFAEAASACEHALALLRRDGMSADTAKVEKRLELYRGGRAYTAPLRPADYLPPRPMRNEKH